MLCKGISYLWDAFLWGGWKNKRHYILRNDVIKSKYTCKQDGFKNKEGTTDANFPPKWYGWWWMIRMDGNGKDGMEVVRMVFKW